MVAEDVISAAVADTEVVEVDVILEEVHARMMGTVNNQPCIARSVISVENLVKSLLDQQEINPYFVEIVSAKMMEVLLHVLDQNVLKDQTPLTNLLIKAPLVQELEMRKS